MGNCVAKCYEDLGFDENMNIRNKKAFTIVELLVAVGLLVAMMAASVVVFRVAIDAQLKATATGDYTRSITATTTKLQQDFSSIDINAPFAIWFDKNGSDRIFFFATGQFEEVTDGNLDTGSTISTYGALLYANDSTNLLRRFTGVNRYQDVITPSINAFEERNELYTELSSAISYDKNIQSTYDLLLSDQIESFKVQILYGSSNGTVRWYPDDNPYSQVEDDSDFELMNTDSFGVFFNILADNDSDFYPIDELKLKLINQDHDALSSWESFNAGYKPLAFKFTITLKDDDNKIDAKSFTYVVSNNQ